MKKTAIFLVLSLFCINSSYATVDGKMPEPKPGSPELEQIKALAGTWEGTSETDGKTEPAAIEYKVTSMGSAVVETLFPGTPHEMVSVYHDDENGKLTMTHYCAIGNQPQLDLKKSEGGVITLDLSPKSKNLESSQHMHGLNLDLSKPGELTQDWTCFDGGKANHKTTIAVKKV